MSNPTTPSPPAGWYPDPAGSPRSRWFDGTQWTDHYAPPPVTAPQVPQPPQPNFAPQAPQQPYGQQVYGQQQAYAAAPVLRAPEGTRPNNGFIWFYSSLLVLPIITFAAFDLSGVMRSSVTETMANPTNPFAAYGAILTPGYTVLLFASFLYYASSVVFAFRDYRAQLAAGIPRPFHWAWTFLNSLVYIIGRTVVVKRRTGGGLGPLWLYLGLYLLYIVVVTIKSVVATSELLQYGLTTVNGLT